MNHIKILDDATINQIAAGEVIENPASIVKELVENSIDAMATNITVEIRDGGRTYIRVTDNGTGFAKDDLPLAFLRHSTSKLAQIEDLYGIATMGFRGEALASIGAVSKVTCISKEKNSPQGYRYIFSFGIPGHVEDYATNQGSTILVESLFSNLPVRKNFLKSDLQEASTIQQLMTSFALSHSSIAFTYIKDGRILLKTVANERLQDRIYQVLGTDVAKNLWRVKDEACGIEGFISNNLLYRSTRMHQYITINRRMVKFPELMKGIEKKYRSIIPLQKYPLFVLNLTLPKKAIDVNVHPNKTVVHIDDINHYLEQWEQLIGKVLRDSMQIPAYGKEKTVPLKETIFEKFAAQPKINPVIETPTVWDPPYVNPSLPPVQGEKVPIVHEVMDMKSSLSLKEDTDVYDHVNEDPQADTVKMSSVTQTNPVKDLPVSEMLFVGQLFGTYLLYEGEGKLLVIDQHAAHERVTYEMYLKNVQEHRVHQQELIIPLMMKYRAHGLAENDLFFERLKNIGFAAAPFDDDTIAIRSVPVLWGEPLSRGSVHAIIDEVLHHDAESYTASITLDEFFIERIMKKACIKAIKAGQVFDAPSAIDLLKKLRETSDPLTCPHGRPTILIQTKKDFDQNFLRELS